MARTVGDLNDLDSHVREVQGGAFKEVRTITARWQDWELAHGALDVINSQSDLF